MQHLEPSKFSDPMAFERFTCDYLSAKLGVQFVTFGRVGQTQNGIDGIHYKPDINSCYNVVQCKNYNETKLTYEDIIENLNKAKKSNLKIDKFYFVTASNKDVLLQGEFQKEYQNLVKNYNFDVELVYYLDMYHDVVTSFHDIAKKYSLPQVNSNIDIEYVRIRREKDLYFLLNVAYITESSFINMPFYIDKTKFQFNPQYSSFSTAITCLNDLYPGDIFYDMELNRYLEMFLDYDHMIDQLLIPNYSIMYNENPSKCYPYEYIGKEEDKPYIKRHLTNRFENYSFTFKQFLAYLKDNYLHFDITKNYYQDPYK